MINMARRRRSQRVGLVCLLGLEQAIATSIDIFVEDPAEFFSMIFGGDAFVDLYVIMLSTCSMSQLTLRFSQGLGRYL